MRDKLETINQRESELKLVEEIIQRESDQGEADLETKHVRVRRGVYAMKGGIGNYVIRARMPAGRITPDQLECLAQVVEKHSGFGFAHLTTRQGIEISNVPGGKVAAILRELEDAGLTTRKTGGNVVRGVVCCPVSGVSASTIFDVTPYALAVDDYLRDYPDYQALPRKVKISFESCQDDHVRTAVSDIGLLARLSNGREGFLVRVGGGLGAVPVIAHNLEEFTPVDMLLPTIEAILRVFNREGNRTDRAHARLKWLIKKIGVQEFRDQVFLERSHLLTMLNRPLLSPSFSNEPQGESIQGEDLDNSPAFIEWRSNSVQAQKQPGFHVVVIRCPLGELSPAQMRVLSGVGHRFAGGLLRTTIDQNVVLRWVQASAFPAIYKLLRPSGLATCCAEQIMDITRCAGGRTCLSAITDPVGACRALSSLFTNEFLRAPAHRQIRIRISGCTNSCSHHPFSDIGLHGTSKLVHGRPVPHYAVFLGGDVRNSRLARRILQVPAFHLKEAIGRVLKFYSEEREQEEMFGYFVERKGPDFFRSRLNDLCQIPSPEEGPLFYRDLEGQRDFVLEAGEGECWA